MARQPRYTDAEVASLGLDPARLPRHVASIMDGNGRWARARYFPRIEGHRRGVRTVRMMIEECARFGLQQLTLFCFSSENWKRPPMELRLLMNLLEQYVVEERAEIMEQGLQFAMIGRREGLPEGVLREVDKTVHCSRNNTGMRLCLAVNYGSRAEIVDAVKAIAREAKDGTISPEKIDEETIRDHLYTAGMPDPDLVIRTAGELRISNFLLWQISYAELWVTPKFWPEFSRDDLVSALKAYAQRDRRFGGLNAAS